MRISHCIRETRPDRGDAPTDRVDEKVLAGVADHPQPVAHRIEVHAELRSLQGWSEGRAPNRSRRSGARLNGIEAAGRADTVEGAGRGSNGDADEPLSRLQPADRVAELNGRRGAAVDDQQRAGTTILLRYV